MSLIIQVISIFNFLMAIFAIIPCFGFIGKLPLALGLLLFMLNLFEIYSSKNTTNIRENSFDINAASVWISLWNMYW